MIFKIVLVLLLSFTKNRKILLIALNDMKTPQVCNVLVTSHIVLI